MYDESHLGYFFYTVQFSDIHGNLSEFSDELHGRYPTSVGDLLPQGFALGQNSPNPFNPQTTIAFELPNEQAISLHVCDVSGRFVRVLVDREIGVQGRNEMNWAGRDDTGRRVASGTYYYRLEAGEYSETKRMALIK